MRNPTADRSIRRLITGALVLAALVLAGCGSNSSNSSSSTTPAASSGSTSSSGSSSSGIPQGPNAGDKDADNSGGPSDGDGNL